MKRNRTNFNPKWEAEYFFMQNEREQCICMICEKNLAIQTKFNIERHYNIYHARDFGQNKDLDRDKRAQELKAVILAKMPSNTGSFDDIDKCAVKASYMVAVELARRKRPLDDATFIQDLAVEMLKCFGESGIQSVKNIQQIPLSARTMARRIEDVDTYIYHQLRMLVEKSTYISICLDESTDITDISQLLIFVRIIDSNFYVTEEMLNLVPLRGNARGIDIYEAVHNVLTAIGGLDKLCSICTDGAPAMIGRKEGFVGQLLKNNFDVLSFHCIIHQQALLSKSATIQNCMKTTVSIVNKIRGGHNSLTHRKFVHFLEEYNSQYGDLLMYTEVRWLSRGKCLQRFFDLRKEVIEFVETNLKNGAEYLEELKSTQYSVNLAFLTDITGYLSILNLSLQGQNKNVMDLVTTVKGFKQKLTLLLSFVQKNDLTHFQNCKTLQDEGMEVNLCAFVGFMESIIENISSRFTDFQKIESLVNMFCNPMTCDLEQQAAEHMMELCDLQADVTVPLETGLQFWKAISGEKYPTLKKAMLKLCCIFGSTYMCECSFSTMKAIKSKSRNRLSNKQLEALLRVATSHIEMNFDDIIDFNV